MVASWLTESPWWRQFSKYGECPYCFAPGGEPCIDQRWDGKHPRWCRKPHPERKHVRLVDS